METRRRQRVLKTDERESLMLKFNVVLPYYCYEFKSNTFPLFKI